MRKHTPGPWLVNRLNTSRKGRTVRGIYRADGRGTAIAFLNGDPGPKAVTDANACLLAAAPELLKAARVAMPWVAIATARDPDTTHPKAISNAEDDLAILRAVIAKAEGRRVTVPTTVPTGVSL